MANMERCGVTDTALFTCMDTTQPPKTSIVPYTHTHPPGHVSSVPETIIIDN